MTGPDIEDEGDRDARLARAAVARWLKDKPPEVWRWMISRQEANHDEYGILDWMKSQPQFAEAIGCAPQDDLPEEYRPYHDAGSWRMFAKLGNRPIYPQPGTAAFDEWKHQANARVRHEYPGIFGGDARLRRDFWLGLVGAVLICALGLYACAKVRLG